MIRRRLISLERALQAGADPPCPRCNGTKYKPGGLVWIYQAGETEAPKNCPECGRPLGCTIHLPDNGRGTGAERQSEIEAVRATVREAHGEN